MSFRTWRRVALLSLVLAAALVYFFGSDLRPVEVFNYPLTGGRTSSISFDQRGNLLVVGSGSEAEPPHLLKFRIPPTGRAVQIGDWQLGPSGEGPVVAISASADRLALISGSSLRLVHVPESGEGSTGPRRIRQTFVRLDQPATDLLILGSKIVVLYPDGKLETREIGNLEISRPFQVVGENSRLWPGYPVFAVTNFPSGVAYTVAIEGQSIDSWFWPASPNSTCIYGSSHQDMLLGDDQGFLSSLADASRSVLVYEAPIRAIVKSQEGHLFVGGEANGIFWVRRLRRIELLFKGVGNILQLASHSRYLAYRTPGLVGLAKYKIRWRILPGGWGVLTIYSIFITLLPVVLRPSSPAPSAEPGSESKPTQPPKDDTPTEAIRDSGQGGESEI